MVKVGVGLARMVSDALGCQCIVARVGGRHGTNKTSMLGGLSCGSAGRSFSCESVSAQKLREWTHSLDVAVLLLLTLLFDVIYTL